MSLLHFTRHNFLIPVFSCLLLSACGGAPNEKKANQAPVVETQKFFDIAEGVKSFSVDAYDPDGDKLKFEISGGADADKFTVREHTGEIIFVEEPNFESPGDQNQDNIYDLTVKIQDVHNEIVNHAMTITITDANVIRPKVIFPPTQSNFLGALDKVTIRGKFEDEMGRPANPSDIDEFTVGGKEPSIIENTWTVEVELAEENDIDIKFKSKEGFYHGSKLHIVNKNKPTNPNMMVFDPIKNRVYIYDVGQKAILFKDLNSGKLSTLVSGGFPVNHIALFVTENGQSLLFVGRYAHDKFILKVDTTTGGQETVWQKGNSDKDSFVQAYGADYDADNNRIIFVTDRNRIGAINIAKSEYQTLYEFPKPTLGLPDIDDIYDTSLRLGNPQKRPGERSYSKIFLSNNANSVYTVVQSLPMRQGDIGLNFVEIDLLTKDLRFITSKKIIEESGLGNVSARQFTFHKPSNYIYLITQEGKEHANIIKVSVDEKQNLEKILSVEDPTIRESTLRAEFFQGASPNQLHIFNNADGKVSRFDLETYTIEPIYHPHSVSVLLPELRAKRSHLSPTPASHLFPSYHLSFDSKNNRIQGSHKDLMHYYLETGNKKKVATGDKNLVFASSELLKSDSQALVFLQRDEILADDIKKWPRVGVDQSLALINLRDYSTDTLINFGTLDDVYYQYQYVGLDKTDGVFYGLQSKTFFPLREDGQRGHRGENKSFYTNLKSNARGADQIVRIYHFDRKLAFDYKNKRQFFFGRNEKHEVESLKAANLFEEGETLISMDGIRGSGPGLPRYGTAYFDEDHNNLYLMQTRTTFTLMRIDVNSGDREVLCSDAETKRASETATLKMFGIDTKDGRAFLEASRSDGIFAMDLETCTIAFLLD